MESPLFFLRWPWIFTKMLEILVKNKTFLIFWCSAVQGTTGVARCQNIYLGDALLTPQLLDLVVLDAIFAYFETVAHAAPVGSPDPAFDFALVIFVDLSVVSFPQALQGLGTEPQDARHCSQRQLWKFSCVSRLTR